MPVRMEEGRANKGACVTDPGGTQAPRGAGWGAQVQVCPALLKMEGAMGKLGGSALT